VVSLRDAVRQGQPSAAAPHGYVAVVFDITNTGRSAAHNVTCEFTLDERYLVLDDMHGENHDFEQGRIGPASSGVHDVRARTIAPGATEARYRCVYDEVGEIKGVVEFDVPKGGA
jgi:hypothetical protein